MNLVEENKGKKITENWANNVWTVLKRNIQTLTQITQRKEVRNKIILTVPTEKNLTKTSICSKLHLLINNEIMTTQEIVTGIHKHVKIDNTKTEQTTKKRKKITQKLPQ